MLNSSPKLTLGVLTLAICAYFCGGYANNVSMNAIGDLTVAMVDDHSLQIDRYSGNSNDISAREGHIYSGFGPGLSLLLVPVYLALKPMFALVPDSMMHRVDTALSNGIYAKHGRLKSTESRAKVVLLILAGTLFVAIPLGMLAAFHVVRICRALIPELSRSDLSGLAFIAAFGTIAFAFTVHLTHTAVAACLIWIALARSLRSEPGESAWAMAWNGLLLGFAPCVDYPASMYALYAAACIVLVARPTVRARTAMLLGGGALPALAVAWAYHFAAFGSAFTNAYRFRVREIDRGIFDIRHLGPTLPNPEKLYVAFLHPYSGLVLYFPLLLLGSALACYFVITERERVRRYFWAVGALTMLTNIGIYSCYPLAVGPASGPIFGVRYTMYSAPFALVAVAALLARLPQRGLARKALFALAILNAIPVLAYVLYGAPVFPSRGYWPLLTQVGPGNYSMTKLYDARLWKYPILAWLGAAVIGALLLAWKRAAGRLIDNWPSTPVSVETSVSATADAAVARRT
jgi:hypothetical protein